ncbi:sugar porter family MFS transporter [Actinomadura opuntiae]|uniref:sugar porter family MFS transporter n=1 Tax=Actinomadura sp. OS1-43 TaxID=604315 RepID=UPI00255A7643|nr:sugar porter family MFS transporter [Actinomadura sp. OS1-43]MDL4821406.1 sugar porter family MFS transporter [Actinomadura sp. OS1-43]
MSTPGSEPSTTAAGEHHGGPSHSAATAALLAGAAALGGFLFGYDSSVINGTVDALKDTFHLSGFAVGFVVSAALLGCAAGAWFAGPIGDRIGRVKVMLAASALFVISSLGSAFAFSAVDLTAWRLVGGLAIGAASVIAPAYIAEIAPAELRGRLGSLQQMAIVLGIFAALVVDYVIAQVSDGGATGTFPWGGGAWRWMFASAAVPAVFWGVIATTIPESPRYLVKKHKMNDARRVLARVMGRGDVDGKIKDIVRSIAEDRPVHLRDLRGSRLGLLPIVWVGILLSVFQQFVGINVIFYYSSSLWQAVGFSESNAMLTSVINSIVNVAFTLVAIALVDRVGRRPLLLGGAAGMALSLGTLTVCFSTAHVVDGKPELSGAAGPIALVAANVFVAAFAATWGPVVWVMLGEMFNNFIRASALAVAAAAQWLANWVVTTTFPGISGFSLSLAYGLYTAFSVLAFFFVIRAVPETKGRELEDMDHLERPRSRAARA